MERGRNSIISFIALAILLYFLGLPTLALILRGIFGSIPSVISTVVSIIPFGEGIFYLAVQIYGAALGQIADTIDLGWSLTFSYLVEELVKGIFVALIFEALNEGVVLVLGLKGEHGIWNVGKRIMVTVADALLAACFAPLIIDFAFEQVRHLGEVGAWAIRIILALIVIFGGIGVFALLKGLTLIWAVLYVAIKFLLLDAASLLISYLSVLVALLALEYGMPLLFLSGVSGLIGIGLIVAGISLALESAFK